MTRVALLTLAVAVWQLTAALGAAQEMAGISVPPSVTFAVSDVGRATPGSPSPTTLSFSNASLNGGQAVRVSVQADAAAFTPPSGSGIPAANVSWSILGAAGGVGSGGTLNATAFGLVYQSNPDTTAGYVDLAWSLAAPGSGIRAGSHHLTIRWKVESIAP